MAGFNMDNYVTVDERIAEFRAQHPEGTLTSTILRYPDADYPFVVVQALAWRHPDDPCPGVGHAAEPYPGKTPYTKDSELMNAETSAWGRAIVAVGAADTKRGIASKDEIANRKGGTGNPSPPGAAATPSSRSAAVPTTSASGAGEAPRQKKGKADWGQEPEGKPENVPPPVGCAHENTSPLGPTGRAVPAGKVFCLDCRTVIKEG